MTVSEAAGSGLEEIRGRSIELPHGETEIGRRAFFHDTELEEIIIPPTVVRICADAFAGCTGLKRVRMIHLAQIETDMLEIRERAFAGCVSLRHVAIPHSVQYIGARAFAGCETLSSANIPVSIRYMAPDCFADCPQLKSVRMQMDTLSRIIRETK